MKTQQRGRPPLANPQRQKDAQKILEKFDSKQHLIWLLTEGGATNMELVESAGIICSRQWVRVIMLELKLGKTLTRRSPLWLVMRLLRKLRRFRGRPENEVSELARRFFNQHWLDTQSREAGSFENLARNTGLSKGQAKRLRKILHAKGVTIPRKIRDVELQCAYCKKKFFRAAWLHRRLLRSRKMPLSFCKHEHYHAFRRRAGLKRK